MRKEFWKDYQKYREIWQSYVNGGEAYYRMTSSRAKNYRDAAKETEEYWLEQHPGKTMEDFQRIYSVWISHHA